MPPIVDVHPGTQAEEITKKYTPSSCESKEAFKKKGITSCKIRTCTKSVLLGILAKARAGKLSCKSLCFVAKDMASGILQNLSNSCTPKLEHKGVPIHFG